MDGDAPNDSHSFSRKPARTVTYAPLLVRPASSGINTPQGRQKPLSSVGILEDLHDPNHTRILVVSFGGQTIRRPYTGKTGNSGVDIRRPTGTFSRKGSTKIFIPGAHTPANNPASPHSPTIPQISSTILVEMDGKRDEDLPPGFYVAPRDVYMPDLMAIADVLLGKLVYEIPVKTRRRNRISQGCGTVSDCAAQSTPLVYVPRPMFVEEHGLRLLLEAEGTGVELSHHEYESGQWVNKVEEAYLKGKNVRPAVDHDENEQEVKNLSTW
ncbi:hypothetical protein JB92DRAFT_2828411 [Gautieria morchelliformis]|nr:hypothetical protein JB92DRAFT_2828411 [Gautieria morchelliformis]